MDKYTENTAELFGRNLLILRINKGITQSKLSEDIGVSASTICNWEMGKRQPSLNMLLKLSEYFEINIDLLLGNNAKYLLNSQEYIIEYNDLILLALKELKPYKRNKLLEMIRFYISIESEF